ncbi:MAG: lamin tail domain-containing protein [Bacteroidia bacterium]
MKKLYTLLSLVLFSFAANAQCTDLVISEYAEGSGSNKYLELYNPTNSTIHLSGYALANTGNAPDSIGFYEFWLNLRSTDSIPSNTTYLICDKDADATIANAANFTHDFLSNGDDGYKLVKGGTFTDLNTDGDTDRYEMVNFTVVDVLGDWQGRPSGGWDVAGETAATKDRVLVRKPAYGGNSDWTTSRGTDAANSEWVVKANEDWSNLGMHSSDCHPPTATEPSTAAADPTADQVDVISLFSGVYTDVTVDTWRTTWSNATLTDTTADGNDIKRYSKLDFVGIETIGANAIDASEMEYISFDAWTADATTYRIKIVDFGTPQSEHEIAFAMPAQSTWTNHKIALSDFTGLTNTSTISQIIFSALPVAGNTLFLDNIYFSKEPTPPVLVYNVADIADIVGLDADFSPVNLDTLYEVTGIVYGIDYQGGDDLTNANAAFTLIDATDGVGVFARGLDYVVKEGDEVTVKGTLDFYNGLTQIAADSITVVSSGNAINDPTDVTSLSEATESDLVKFTKVWVADTADKVWPNNGSIDITNGTDTFAVRIDSDTKGIAGKTIEHDTMNIVGLGGQFDRSAPHNEGYQLLPRDSSDITEWVDMTSVRNVSVQTSVYPNPTSNNLTVVGATKWESFVVYSILGGEMAAGTLNNNNLSVANLNNGTYIIKLVAGEQVGVARFVVSK